MDSERVVATECLKPNALLALGKVYYRRFRKTLGNRFSLWPIRVSVPRFMKLLDTCLFTRGSVAQVISFETEVD